MAWIVSRHHYHELTKDAVVLARSGEQVKVLSLSGGELAKLFHVRRRFSSDWIYPYSLRFGRNAARLIQMGIPSVKVRCTHFVRGELLHVVVYEELRGKTLFEIKPHACLAQLAEFVAKLHHVGVYFRSLHLGNILLTEDGEMGLIDVAAMRFEQC